MSRSRRKHPFVGWSKSDSEKKDKRIANRRLRKNINQKVGSSHVEELEESVIVERRDISNVYRFNKDGKQRIDPDSECMRK